MEIKKFCKIERAFLEDVVPELSDWEIITIIDDLRQRLPPREWDKYFGEK